MGYKYCVFGAGRQGVAAIYDLVKYCNAEYVLVFEPSLTATLDAQERLAELLGSEYSKIAWMVELKEVDWVDWTSFDVMISCAPWKYNVSLTEFAVKNGVPFCDLGGNPDTVTMQEQIKSESPIVPDCGLSPGISNILAACLARRGYDEISVRCGGIPAMLPYSYDELNYFLTFDPMGLISEYSGNANIISGGQILTREALSGLEGWMDHYECAYTSNNSRQVVENLLSLGVINYDYKTLRYHGHFNMVRGWKEAGFLQGNMIADKRLAQTLTDNPKLQYARGYDSDKVLLFIDGYRNIGDMSRESFGCEFEVRADFHTNFSAMEQMTSWGITMVAHYMAENSDSLPGMHGTSAFATPDRFVDADWILDGLKERGV